MKAAIITVAGVSSRFNRDLPEEQHVLKAVYHEGDPSRTLLYRLLQKCAYADKIVVVGGYRYADLLRYCGMEDAQTAEGTHETGPVSQDDKRTAYVIPEHIRRKIITVYNEHYADLASGYSLYLGIEAALQAGATEILFAEGDLDTDDASFEAVVRAEKSVLTYNREPVYANKAVVLYQNAEGKYRYAFNAEHGLLKIEESFSCLLNSGQVWKFTDMDALRRANEAFFAEQKDGTNLYIIQGYLDRHPDCALIPFEAWTNCNTREDYRKIAAKWQEKTSE